MRRFLSSSLFLEFVYKIPDGRERMKKLARKWRKRRGDDGKSLPTSEDLDARPIDTQEQEEIIKLLEGAQAQQSHQWRAVFAILQFCYGMFLLYSLFQQYSSPWELRYHAYFMEDVSSWMIISADLIAMSACFLSIIGLLIDSKDRRKWIWYSFGTGSIVAVYWFYYMMRLPKFRWDVMWLPLGPLCGTGLCLYVDHLLVESSEEIRKLRNYMYNYKAR